MAKRGLFGFGTLKFSSRRATFGLKQGQKRQKMPLASIRDFRPVEAAALSGNQGSIRMINRSRQAALLSALSATALFSFATAAAAQITDSQRAAIRSQCRSDYQAHCAGVPPGGMESLQCLQKNLSSLAPGCQTAVRAVAPPAETKTETRTETKPETKTETTPAPSAEPAPAAPTAGPAVAPAAVPAAAAKATAKKPSSAQVAAIRSACRSDYQKVCAGVPAGGAAALQCLQKNKSGVSAGCQQAIAAAGSAATAAGTAPAAAAPPAAPAAPALALRPMQPREQLFVLRSACGADVRALCGGVAPGGGRMMQCLVAQSASLSPECRSILARFVAR